MRCPNCGYELDRCRLVPPTPYSFGGGAWSDGHALTPLGDSSHQPWAGDIAPIGMGVPAFTEAHQRRPARAADVGSDVVVPTLQAVVSAVVALLVGVIAAIWKEWPWWSPLLWFVAALVAVWIWRLIAHSQSLWVHQDIYNAAPVPAQPAGPSSYSVHVDVNEEGIGPRMDNLPEPRQGALRLFAQAIVGGGVTFSERGAHKYGYPREMWHSKDGLSGLADKFLNHQPPWAIDRGGRLGLELTGRGKAIIRTLADWEPDDDAPSPDEPASA